MQRTESDQEQNPVAHHTLKRQIKKQLCINKLTNKILILFLEKD